jgi:hypothetical protein
MSGARGEGRLATAQGEVVVLFTNRALAEAENLTGKSILQLAAAARSDALGMGTLVQLLAVGMEFARREAGTGGARITTKDAYAVLDEVGFIRVVTVVLEALATVLAFGADEAVAADPLAP